VLWLFLTFICCLPASPWAFGVLNSTKSRKIL
jgi:hypothetical protein